MILYHVIKILESHIIKLLYLSNLKIKMNLIIKFNYQSEQNKKKVPLITKFNG